MALIIAPGQLTQRSDFYFQLQSLFTAGVPVIQALEMLVQNPPARSYRQPLQKVIFKLQQGATLNEALHSVPGWLPEFDLALLAAGEQSGRLESILKLLGNYYRDRADLMRNIISDLMYPVFVLHIALLIFPTGYLTRLFLAGGVEAFIQQKLLVFIPFYLGVFALIVAAQATHGVAWRAFLENVYNVIPMIRSAVKHLVLARFCAALEALLSAGVTVIQAWKLAGQASGSFAINRSVEKAIPQIQAGKTPSEVVRNLHFFPDMFKSLYTSGEISGQLDSTLQRLHQYYQEQATLKFRNFGKWLPRILFLLLALGIGYSVVRFYMNYYGQMMDAF